MEGDSVLLATKEQKRKRCVNLKGERKVRCKKNWRKNKDHPGDPPFKGEKTEDFPIRQKKVRSRPKSGGSFPAEPGGGGDERGAAGKG